MTLQEILPKYTASVQENQRLQFVNVRLKQELAELKRLIFGQKRIRELEKELTRKEKALAGAELPANEWWFKTMNGLFLSQGIWNQP